MVLKCLGVFERYHAQFIDFYAAFSICFFFFNFERVNICVKK